MKESVSIAVMMLLLTSSLFGAYADLVETHL